MQLRILGVNNISSKGTRQAAYLIDGVLALDAGGLTGLLTFDEQKLVRAVVLSHRHFDHTLDLLPFGLSIVSVLKAGTVEVYGIRDTIDFVRSNILGGIHPAFLDAPEGEPAFHLNVVDFHEEFDVLGYTVKAVPVPHAVPAAGIEVSSGDVKLFYTGDTGKGLDEAWNHVSPDVLLTECTFGNEGQARAMQAGHLTPALLGEALSSFRAQHGYLPRVIVTHITPVWEDAVRREIPQLSEQLGHEILVAHADMTLDL